MSYIYPLIAMILLVALCFFVCRKVNVESKLAENEARAHRLIMERVEIQRMAPSMEQVEALQAWKVKIDDYAISAMEHSTRQHASDGAEYLKVVVNNDRY